MIDEFLALHAQIMDPERIPFAIMAVLIAMIIGMITGPVFANAQPLIWQIYERIFGALGDKMNKTERPKGDLIFRGFLLTTITLIFAYVIGLGIEYLAIHYPFYMITEALLLSLLLSLGSVWFALLQIYFALSQKDKPPEGAYLTIARTCRANLNASDDFGITRLSIGLSAKSFDKSVVAPVFWYLIGGLPVAVIYTALATLTWRFAREGVDKGFGHTALALEKLMGVVPSLMAAALITIASAFSPTAKLGQGLSSWFGMKNRATYAQGALPLSSLAWALNVSLGGPYQGIDGDPIKRPWVGPDKASAQNDYTHLRRALIISVIAHALFIVTLASAYMWGTALS